MGNCSLTRNERETIISFNDSDKNIFFIYSTQQPMIRKLLRNPLFVCTLERFNEEYTCHPDPISVEGYLPSQCLTIRKKLRQLTDEDKQQLQKRLQQGRKQRKK